MATPQQSHKDLMESAIAKLQQYRATVEKGQTLPESLVKDLKRIIADSGPGPSTSACW